MLKFAEKETNSWYMQIMLQMELFKRRAICICDNHRKFGKKFEYVGFYFRRFSCGRITGFGARMDEI
jgi:hypothetical protein